MSDNEKAVIVLLPGMDGTGILFNAFVRLLPNEIDVKIVPYPEDKHLTYEQLAERVMSVLPSVAPYVIIAESYSGPVASLLAAHPVGNLNGDSGEAERVFRREAEQRSGMIPNAIGA